MPTLNICRCTPLVIVIFIAHEHLILDESYQNQPNEVYQHVSESISENREYNDNALIFRVEA